MKVPEFECTCEKDGMVGVIVYLADISNPRQAPGAKLSFYGCRACHRLYYDMSSQPLTQKHINRGSTGSAKNE